MTKTELLDRVTKEIAGSSEQTTKQFVKVTSQFYTFSGGEFTRRAVVNYIKNLAREGYGPGTNRLHYRVLKRSFDIAGKLDPSIEWPFSKRAPAEIELLMTDIPWEENKNKVAFTAEEIRQMIDAAKEGKLSGLGVALVALSTTYGLRRIEMADLDPESLNLKTKRLRVFTKHGSKLREHVIPDEIIRYLKDYQPLRSEFKLSEIFHDIERDSGLPERYGTGWHCIRRGLVNNLVGAKLDMPAQKALLYIYDFMRWKKSIAFQMIGTYFTEPPKVIDEAILKVHPFLGYWR
jgi:integrase